MADSLPGSSSKPPSPKAGRVVGTKTLTWVTVGGVVLLGCVCAAWALVQRDNVPVYGYKVVQELPHDGNAFTQGLIFTGGHLIEGTGLYGESTLRKVGLKTGQVLLSVPLDQRVFGEGVTQVGDEIYQLTWKSRTGFIYDAKTLAFKRRFRYSGQGWGLTYDGKHLIISDGSSQLRFYDPKTMRLKRRVRVTAGRRAVRDLNELEYVNGNVLANVWHTDRIAQISPTTGKVTAWYNLRGLLPAKLSPNEEAVLNGIAWDATEKRLFVTGKNWPRLYEIQIVSPQ